MRLRARLGGQQLLITIAYDKHLTKSENLGFGRGVGGGTPPSSFWEASEAKNGPKISFCLKKHCAETL